MKVKFKLSEPGHEAYHIFSEKILNFLKQITEVGLFAGYEKPKKEESIFTINVDSEDDLVKIINDCKLTKYLAGYEY